MERCDFVNENLTLIQKLDGLTFGTDALLLSAYISGKFKRGLEIGSGSGIISLLLLSRDKLEQVVALDVQEEYASLTARNAEENGLSSRLSAVCADVREYKSDGEFDVIYTNPPYMKATSGKMCENDKKSIARHEIYGTIEDFCASAERLLKYGGTFAAVYRPDRLCDLMSAMRASHLEPKRMTLVHADTESEPSMALVIAKGGGKSGMTLTRPLIIYKDKEHKEYTDDMNYIMENGVFPSYYKR